ncbi:DUF6221 family protein [Streptomyces sp. NPDC056465]|uniref:DUF6221 family protein n=1 Tax=unclassified Streptomyces TaxID=2593676 RepID=UPI0035E0C99E
MTADLFDFLRARLDEQAAAAVSAGGTGEVWRALGTGVYSAATAEDDVPPLVTAGPEVGGSDEDAARAEHIALHGPAQVLRQVEATRGLLERYTASGTGAELPDVSHRSADDVHRMAVDMVVRHLAQAHADHPDHRPEWRP